MTRREQLQDRYEDARFALLMDEIATAEGQWAQGESDRLNADGAAAVPEDLDRRCRQTIRGAQTRRRLRAVGRFTGKALKRVALAAGVAAILFTTAFALSETVRINTLNFIVKVFDTNTSFYFSSRPGDISSQFTVGWMPDGYLLESHDYDGVSTWSQYYNPEGGSVLIDCTLTMGTTVALDTENATVEGIKIRNINAMLVTKGNGLQLAWVSKDNTRFITITGSDISREDILRIADELSY